MPTKLIINNSSLIGHFSVETLKINQRSYNNQPNSVIQCFEADFLLKVSHKILNSRIIMKTFTYKTGRGLIIANKVYSKLLK